MFTLKKGLRIRNLHIKSFAVMIILFLCLSSFNQTATRIFAGSSDRFLVLVQQKDGTWKRYENLVEKSESGSLMIKAKAVSKVLGLTYKKSSDGTFFVKRSKTRYNTYTKNSKAYSYTNGAVVTAKSAQESAYTSKQSKYNLCQINTLSTLVHYRYFDNVKSIGYEDYKGVICYSKYDPIPDKEPVSEPVPTKKPTPTPIPEPTSISIEGVEFPVRKSFLSLKEAMSDWGGTTPIWGKLEREVDQKIIDATDLVFDSDSIGFSHLVTGANGVYLTKASKGYQLSIDVKLTGSVLAEQNAAIIKAMITTISSKPTQVYQAIYDSFTSDNSHGIKEGSYVVIGDCRIKVTIKDGTVTYHIIEA